MKCTSGPPVPREPRRTFVKALAGAIGGVLGLVPVLAGVCVWLDPVRRRVRSGTGAFLRVATLDALPADGVPRRFAVVAEKFDAWTRTPQTPVGAVYLRRVTEGGAGAGGTLGAGGAEGTGAGKITALNVVCPHAGCFVDYQASRPGFFCPCHNSTFAVSGAIDMPASPSPRGMDELAVEVRGREIWVKFQNFQTGRADKVALS